MIRTQIQIEPEQIKWLKRQALGRGISMAQLIRDSINFYRTHIEKSRALLHKKKNALAAVGTFSSVEKR
jgi:hypothetical protein